MTTSKRWPVLLLALAALAATACAAPLAGRSGAGLQPASSGWWLCDPPGLWEDRG